MLVRDPKTCTRGYFLGSNFPLGDGSCLGTTIPLTDNQPGDPPPSREDWFRILNSMFWVFDEQAVNAGVLRHLRSATANNDLVGVRILTRALPDALIEENVRLSAINGGGSNGACPRGTATYKRLREWTLGWPPKEIGLADGLSAELCGELRSSGGVLIDDA